MSAFAFDHALKLLSDGTITDATSLVVMLINGSYTPSKGDQNVSANIAAAEVTATGYTRAWGGAGRKATTVTVAEDNTAHVIRWKFSNVTWAALGGATNDTVVGAVLIKSGSADDTTSIPIAWWPLAASVPTNGSSFTLTMDSTNGNLTIST